METGDEITNNTSFGTFWSEKVIFQEYFTVFRASEVVELEKTTTRRMLNMPLAEGRILP